MKCVVCYKYLTAAELKVSFEILINGMVHPQGKAYCIKCAVGKVSEKWVLEDDERKENER
jgi:hypothetical protein